MNFKELNLIQPINRAVTAAGYTSPTEIQSKAIPHILKGKDVLGCAQTGTGKTAAFAIPILQNLQEKKNDKGKGMRTLILTPTRELAIQVADSFKTYGKYLPIKSLAIYGGVKQGRQVAGLKKGADVLIATPGRLMDLMRQGYVKLSRVETVVLDEADRMLDMGFVNDVRKILSEVPKKRQTLLFSATMPKSIKKFANSVLHQPVKITVSPSYSAAETVNQCVYYVQKKEKTRLLINILKDESILRSLVFTRTKHGADRLVKKLGKTGINAAAIHGNKSQGARQRTLKNFKQSKIRVLVATDIASRGIDIDDLSYVFNYELPNVPETYVHRIGRTGRAGKDGVAVSFCDRDEKKHLKGIQRLVGFQIPEKAVNSHLN